MSKNVHRLNVANVACEATRIRGRFLCPTLCRARREAGRVFTWTWSTFYSYVAVKILVSPPRTIVSRGQFRFRAFRNGAKKMIVVHDGEIRRGTIRLSIGINTKATSINGNETRKRVSRR